MDGLLAIWFLLMLVITGAVFELLGWQGAAGAGLMLGWVLVIVAIKAVEDKEDEDRRQRRKSQAEKKQREEPAAPELTRDEMEDIMRRPISGSEPWSDRLGTE
jgi:membrane protein implicated in regulation of membrane protease activity